MVPKIYKIITGFLLVLCLLPSGAGRVSAQTSTPSGEPRRNKISWKTEHVSLTADNFYINVNGKLFWGNPDTLRLNSDPPQDAFPKETTLEAVWEENGVEMRMFLYFDANYGRWWSYEIRIYDGNTPGDWIYHKEERFNSLLGQPYTYSGETSLRGYSSDGTKMGMVHFENLKVQAFLKDGQTLNDYKKWEKEFTGEWTSKDYDLDKNGKVDIVDFEILRRSRILY